MNMKNKPKVSIIVPIYNVEEYLEQCLKCLVNQSYDKYEIILVDDGSTDCCGSICDQYAQIYKEIRVIHQKNIGLSGARNNGVSESVGEYITFVDPDDLITYDYVEILINSILEENSDVAIARTVKFWGEFSTPIRKNEVVEKIILNPGQAIVEMCYGKKYGVSACCKMYHRELLKRYPYPLGKLHEDLATTHKILGNAKRIVYCDCYLYFYRQRKNSISNQRFNRGHFFALKAAQELIDYMSINYPNCESAAKFRYVLEASIIISMLLHPNKENKIVFREIRNKTLPYCKNVLFDHEATVVTKIRALSICMGYYSSILIFRIIEIFRITDANRRKRILTSNR